MQAVAAVGEVVAKVTSQQRINDIVVEDLVKSSNAAAAAACARGEANTALRTRVEELERENVRLVTDLDLAGSDSACCRARHRAEEERDILRASLEKYPNTIEQTTAEAIAAWLDGEQAKYKAEWDAAAQRSSPLGGLAMAAHDATGRLAADIRAGAWREEKQ
jgi:hypothetical protein